MRIAIIGGTGIGERLIDEMGVSAMESRTIDTPFGAPSDAITLATLDNGAEIALLARHAPGHRIPPHRLPSRANIWALKSLGVTHAIATGACGSLSEAIHPGDLVLPDQAIDRTDGRERTFFDDLAVHVEFGEPFCPVMRDWLGAGACDGVTLHRRATYLAMNGPSFSTRAESELHRSIGAHVVGMTALPEGRLAREAEIAYALLAIPTDYDCWRPQDPAKSTASLLSEIRANLKAGTDAAFALIRGALADPSVLRETPSPAHTALAHAIWTDPAHIAPGTRERVSPLIARYL